ncbi:hypothetical protein [Pendulispora albinea]|uniref:Uncharacterized protein n=1 Tax=Pendulispora albinea TaxID=2741071 RepID=A0ABZ2LPU5_9BACT
MTQNDDQRDKGDGMEVDSHGDHEAGDSEPKKERVLHTRVPAVLERELKRFADNLRVPVSNLVRTILEDALNVADAATENVESRLRKAAKQLEHERERLKARVKFDPLKDIFAFQRVTLAQDATCAKCERDLAAGAHANLGLSDEPTNGKKKPRIFVCDECLPGAR